MDFHKYKGGPKLCLPSLFIQAERVDFLKQIWKFSLTPDRRRCATFQWRLVKITYKELKINKNCIRTLSILSAKPFRFIVLLFLRTYFYVTLFRNSEFLKGF